jgi:hypothetical protein
MLDVQWIGSVGTTLERAAFSWLPGVPLGLLLELIVWFAAVAGLGMFLSFLRGLSSPTRSGWASQQVTERAVRSSSRAAWPAIGRRAPVGPLRRFRRLLAAAALFAWSLREKADSEVGE